MKLDYRLGLDLGTNSIGWCVYRLTRDEEAGDDWERWAISGIQRMGVRIFSDGRNPKDLASLAAARRQARQIRRRRDRTLRRRQRLIDALTEFGLMPADETSRKALVVLDPYELRDRALRQPVPLHELGRAIFHLARKRGFRSGRKDFSTDDTETGKVKDGIKRLKQRLAEAGCATVGQYLAAQHARRAPILARPGPDGEYPIYLARELVADEFDQIWAAQEPHHAGALHALARDKIRDIILFQRKLRPVQPGRCLFERDQPRALLAHPLTQRFRILQELANLRIQYGKLDDQPLTGEQRAAVLDVLSFGGPSLNEKGILTWAKLRNLVGVPRGTGFNLDTAGRPGLKADSVSIALAAVDALGPDWRSWDADRQDRFLHALRAIGRREEAGAALAATGFPVPEAKIDAVFRVAARMPDEFGSVSLAALRRIVPELEAPGVQYDKAVVLAGYQSHSDFYDGELHPTLPYYGKRLPGYVQPRDVPGATAEEREYGRIANPTVHVGLNQLRTVVNAILNRYGHPKQIIVEVARELGLSGQHRRELESEQQKNRAANVALGEELERLGQRNSRENRQRLQLFKELTAADPLGAECVYSGERISPSRLFSGEVDIDHILPFSRSLDDGLGNKLLCVRRANRDKAQGTPFEAFGHSPGSYSWPDILSRVERLLPKRKAARFAERAMEEFLRDRDFLDRHLTDTAYFSRVARIYLTAICPPNCIWVSTGKLTAMLRGRWNLNAVLSDSGVKERNDHRHHAVDAAVIGACDRRLIRKLATAASRAEAEGESRLLRSIEPPWPGFFDDVRNTTHKIAVSFKPEHGVEGALHNDTVYGEVEPPDAMGRSLVARRVSILDLKGPADLDALADVGPLRGELASLLASVTGAAAIKSALAEFSNRTGVRRVRIVERLTVEPIRNPHRDQSKYVKTDGNYCYDVVRDAQGRWKGYAVTRFTAQRYSGLHPRRSVDGRPLVMRLRIDDCIAAEREGQTPRIYRVVQVTDARIVLAANSEAGALRSRHADTADEFQYWFASPSSLLRARARVVGIDPLGYVNDPGFRP